MRAGEPDAVRPVNELVLPPAPPRVAGGRRRRCGAAVRDGALARARELRPDERRVAAAVVGAARADGRGARAQPARLVQRGPHGRLLLRRRPRDQAGAADRLASHGQDGHPAVHRRARRHAHADGGVRGGQPVGPVCRRLTRRARRADGHRHRLRHGHLLPLQEPDALLGVGVPPHARDRRRPGRDHRARDVLRDGRIGAVPRHRRAHHARARARRPPPGADRR
mmetsp:Transcript_10609/g.33420  ORF Transcript_10609/g.33420 Transcript_10609/m.33420 type:complete len:224 (+) Transcript_10609:86-757(+)